MSGSCNGLPDEPCAVRCQKYDEVFNDDDLPICRECRHGKSWHSGPLNTAVSNLGGRRNAVDLMHSLLNSKTSYEDARFEANATFRSPAPFPTGSSSATVKSKKMKGKVC